MAATMQFTFDESVPIEEAEDTLRLAQMAVESLHGRERIELEAPVVIDKAKRQFFFDTSRGTGRTLALVFAGYIRREFGFRAVQVVHHLEKPAAAEAAQ